MGSPIAVFGSINMDLVIYSQTKPLEGETIFGNSFETFQGGKGANQAVAISKLGGDVTQFVSPRVSKRLNERLNDPKTP